MPRCRHRRLQATGRAGGALRSARPLAERREQLLDAALAVIVSDGYARISIDAIAKRAQVARSVVYGAFEDLDDLLLTLLDRQQELAFTRLLASVPDTLPTRDPVDFACEAVHRMAAMLREDPDTWRLILLTPATTPPAVHARIEADRERFRRRVASWIESAPAAEGRRRTPRSSPTRWSPPRSTSRASRSPPPTRSTPPGSPANYGSCSAASGPRLRPRRHRSGTPLARTGSFSAARPRCPGAGSRPPEARWREGLRCAPAAEPGRPRGSPGSVRRTLPRCGRRRVRPAGRTAR